MKIIRKSLLALLLGLSLAYCLAGENANEKNLITGTRYLNIEGMLPYETLTAKYIVRH